MDPVAAYSIGIVESGTKAVAYTVSPDQRQALSHRPRENMEQEPGMRFVYLYGSVLESDRVHDWMSDSFLMMLPC